MTRKEKSQEELHDEYVSESRKRWQALLGDRPCDDPARLPNGFCEVAFSVVAPEVSLSLRDLRDKMEQHSQKSDHSLYPFSDAHFRARPMGNAIETLYPEQCKRIGDDNLDYFWHATIDGQFYHVGPYNYGNAQASNDLDIVKPIVCTTLALTYAAIACKNWGNSVEFFFGCRFTGLYGRELSSTNFRIQMSLSGKYHCCNTDMALETICLQVETMDEELAQVLHRLLLPLYEQFNYFPLGLSHVEEVLSHLGQLKSP